ncbi:MAG: tRNA (adenosine(37)-N6)-threonylcarbamoyltransferase complex ATPase subunit type 1 TsaE [Eudoraea sp.]|nr:tRNA (adenosine(37)-N6)-threonylcarbamoyltransferase complex ATPase subunit type 1 TsaE [Eudoraea sp.]
MTNIFYDIEEIDTVAKKIISQLDAKVLAFMGEMGAGKTTLIKALVKALGGVDSGSSPTFGLVNEYHTPDGELLGYHFDFYRIEDLSEVLDLGFEDYLARDCWIFMEWPEKITPLLPEDHQVLQLYILGPEERRVEVKRPDINTEFLASI